MKDPYLQGAIAGAVAIAAAAFVWFAYDEFLGVVTWFVVAIAAVVSRAIAYKEYERQLVLKKFADSDIDGHK